MLYLPLQVNRLLTENERDEHKNATRRRGAALPQRRSSRKNRDRTDQTLSHAIRSVAGLLARRGGPVAGHRRRAGRRLQVHGQGQPRSRDLERHGRARTGQHRSAGGQARHGGQEHAFQDLCGHRRLRHRGRHDRSRGVHPHGESHRAHLRGHQSRRHQGSGVLRDREPPARGTGHPPDARRPARHGDHLLGGTSERRENRRQGAGQNARRGQRRGSRRHRLRAPVRGTRHPPRKRGALRQSWSRHGLPRGHQPDEA